MPLRRPILDQRFVVDDLEPAYLATYRSGLLGDKVAAARRALADCLACPRDCGVNRTAGERGVCHVGRYALVASAFPHHGEEDCLRGRRGSGTIFFSYCNLQCVFCQNWDISQAPAGRECTADEIADLMLGLQDEGCHNINFVTPEHVAPQVVEAIAAAVPRGLAFPSSTTPAPTTLSSRCARWTAWSTSTCPTSSSGSRRRRAASPGS